jgi:hypothetical protein
MSERTQNSSLRGWLSEVFLPSLLAGELERLLLRLGPRGSVAVPSFGKASGLEEQRELLGRLARWLSEREATFAQDSFLTGRDRDVTAGRLRVKLDGRETEHVIAVVAERRKGRELDLRIYGSRALFGEDPLPTPKGAADLAGLGAQLFGALARADREGFDACFEEGAALHGSAGEPLSRDTLFAQLTGSGIIPLGFAEEADRAALELEGKHGPLLVSLRRGGSALYAELRLIGAAP